MGFPTKNDHVGVFGGTTIYGTPIFAGVILRDLLPLLAIAWSSLLWNDHTILRDLCYPIK